MSAEVGKARSFQGLVMGCRSRYWCFGVAAKSNAPLCDVAYTSSPSSGPVSLGFIIPTGHRAVAVLLRPHCDPDESGLETD